MAQGNGNGAGVVDNNPSTCVTTKSDKGAYLGIDIGMTYLIHGVVVYTSAGK